jgi:hypothetical protein
MSRSRAIFVEPLESRLQFAACPATLPVIEHTLAMNFAAADAADAPVGDAATGPDIEITLEDGTIVDAQPPDSNPIGTAPKAIDFGAIVRNQQATAKAFLIKNLGVNPLSVGDITLPKGFVLVQAPPTTIAPGESGTVVIGLDPSTQGGYVGPVVIASDDPDEPLLSFRVAGEVLPTSIALASVDASRLPAQLVVGRAGPRRPVAVTLHNISEQPFAADSVSLAAYASADASLDAGDTRLAEFARPLRLAGGKTRTFKIMVPPAAFPAGDSTVIASLTIADATVSTAANGPQIGVHSPFVSLTSQPAAAPTAPSATPVSLGKPARVVVAMTNEGNVSTPPIPATFDVAVTTDGTPDTVVASTSVASKLHISPGQTRPVKLAVTFPADAFPAGAYQLLVTIRADSNATNDTFLVTVPIQFA